MDPTPRRPSDRQAVSRTARRPGAGAGPGSGSAAGPAVSIAAFEGSPAETATEVKPWVIYTRVSTDEQARRGLSLGVQEQSCAALLTARGIGRVETIEDGGFSGGTLGRPGMQRLLELIDRQAVAGVCIFAIDRLTRSLRDLLDLVARCERAGVSLLAVREQIDTSGVMGRFVLSLLGAVAQLEREMIGQRVRTSIAHRKAQGAWTGGYVPVGLRSVLDGRLRRLAPDPEAGPIVAEAWNMLIAGRSLMDVVAHFKTHGIRTNRGSTWSRTTMHALVSNDIYIGHLVDREHYELARTALGRRSPRKGGRPLDAPPAPSHRAEEPTPLAGLIFCEHCGSAMVYGSGTSATGQSHRYFRCSGRLKRGRSFCTAADIPAQAFESALIDAIRMHLESGKLLDAYAAGVTRQRAAASLAATRIRELTLARDEMRSRMARVFEVIEGGGLAAQAGRARLELHQDQLNQLEADLATQQAIVAAAEMGDRELAAAETHLRAGVTALVNASPGERATVLQGLVSRITASREKANLDLVGPGSHNCSTWRAR